MLPGALLRLNGFITGLLSGVPILFSLVTINGILLASQPMTLVFPFVFLKEN
jgi:hypothetical protein